MNPEEEALNFHLAVLKEYENIPTFATMGMNPWEDEELAAVRRLIRSERRAQRFIDTVPVLNSYIAEVVAKWPPERITLMMLARIAHYYATCTIFCAVWRARNALEAYLHDQKHLTSPLDVTADEILSADESERSILCSLKSLYNVLYQCPRDEFTNDFREQVAEHIESYLDIALAVADDPQVRRLRDYLRDFFAYDYQPVATRPLTQAEIDALPKTNFEELATLWKDAAYSYAIAFANRNQDKEPVKAQVASVAPEALVQIAAAVNPAPPGTLSELVPVVQMVYTAINKIRAAKKQRRLSYNGAVIYVYNEPDPPPSYYAKIMEARSILRQIIAEKRKLDPDAEQKTLNSLAVMSKPSYKKSKARKKRSSLPSLVPVDQSVRGGGFY